MNPTLERKTEKILDMNVNGLNVYCIFRHDETEKPYHLYCKWYEYKSPTEFGYHRKQYARYNSLVEVIDHIRNFVAKCDGGAKNAI